MEGVKMQLNRLETDYNNFNKRVQKYPDGNIVNTLKLHGMENVSDLDLLGKKLNQIAKTARTGGDYQEVGSIYGFQILVKTEITNKEGIDIKQNQFFVKGEGNISYTHNNGRIAQDPKLASMSFLNALDKIPTLIEDKRKKLTKYEKDLPILQEVILGNWNKETELAELKKDLESIDRKIQLTIGEEEGNYSRRQKK